MHWRRAGVSENETELQTTIESRGAMTASRTRKSGSSARVDVSWFDDVIRLRDEDLFGEQLGDPCLVFLRRVFGLREVISVEINRDQSTADIRYDRSHRTLADLLKRLAMAIRGQSSPDAPALPASSLPQDLFQPTGQIKIQRFGTTLTTWDVVHHQPGRIRLRHQMIRGNPAFASRIRDIVENLPGVLGCSVRPVTGSLLIRFDQRVTSASRFLQSLERARLAPVSSDLESLDPKPVGFALSNTSLVLAVTGKMATPAVLPICAVLLVGSNLGTFREAGRQLVQRQLGLPVLYTSIVAAALATGEFIAAASMSWMLTFWRHLCGIQLVNARRRLMGQIIQQPRFVRLAMPGSNNVGVEIPIEDLKPNDVIVVSAGEQIPVDGRVLRGQGLVDERMVRGTDGLDRKRPDENVFAGSTLRFGELHIEVLKQGPETQAAVLARASLGAITQPFGSQTLTPHGEDFAERTVAPTMAVASLGFLLGDIVTAGAILQPDYVTGLGLAFPLETLQAVALCMRHGIVIREPEAIERLVSADLLLLDHGLSLEHTELEIDGIQTFPGCAEEDLLRYAAAAFYDLDDERAAALRHACRDRRIAPLDVQPVEYATDVTLLVGSDCIKVGDLGSRARGTSKPHDPGQTRMSQQNPLTSLMVGINGRVAGLLHFRRSTKLAAASTLQRLRSKRNVQIGIMSDQPHAVLARLTATLGADFHVGVQSPDDRIHLLQYCRQQGFKVAYIGDCCVDPRIVAEAHVAVSLVQDEIRDFDTDPAPIRLLQPRLSKLNQLWDIAFIHQRRLKVAQSHAVIPNLLCVAGAFVWGFTSLASVVVTNLGTYSVYRRSAASIRSLERQVSLYQPSFAKRN
jgi:cation transport ATPase